MMISRLEKKPEWLRIRLPSGENYVKVRQTIASLGLHTVCEEARCPNIGECWGGGTATIMIMGDICTRGCRFCSVAGGKPLYLDPDEPERVAQAIKKWGLRYVVVTSVCRDDLQDGGANHIAKTIKAVKVQCPETIIEPLIPDFHGNRHAIEKVAYAGPEVISHNIETVARISPQIRDRLQNLYQVFYNAWSWRDGRGSYAGSQGSEVCRSRHSFNWPVPPAHKQTPASKRVCHARK